jgi:serine/threonine protein kinase
MKSINKQYLVEENSKKKVLQEVAILKKTRHRGICQLLDNFETQNHIAFVVELCSGGDMLNYVRKR